MALKKKPVTGMKDMMPSENGGQGLCHQSDQGHI